MNNPFDGNASQHSPLDGKSVEELLLYVADDEQGYRAEATAKLLSTGIAGIYSVLERGVRDDNNADFRNGAMDILVAFGKESVPYLVKLLKDANEEVRNFACVMLGDIGNREAVSPLIRALSDKDVNVSHSAAEALGKIGDRSALFPLIELLKGDFWVQYSAITAIGAMRDYRAVPHLLQMLDNEMLAGAVIDTLGQIGDPRALHPLGRILPSLEPAAAGQAAKALLEIYRAATESLSYKNSLAEYTQPEHLKKVLSKEGVEKLHFLLQSSNDKGAIEAAVMLLGWYGDLSAIDVFFHLLQDEALMGAVEAAVFSMGKKAQPSLVNALEDDIDNVKIVALRTLRYQGAVDIHDKVAAFLVSPNEELQIEAVETAKSCPAEIYRPILLDLVKSGSASVAYKSAEALGSYPFASLKDSLAAMAASDRAETRMRGALLLCHVTEEGEPHLLDTFMHDPDAEVRRLAMKAAGMQKAGVAVPKLGSALHDPDVSVRVAAVMTIAEFRTPLLVEDILAILGTGDESLDYAVIKALGLMGAKSAESCLVAFLDQGCSSRRIEYALLETLGKLSAASASEIIRNRYLSSPDPDIRRLAVDTLGQLGDTSSINAVESALNDSHWSVRVAVLHVLGKLGGIKEIPLLLEAIHDPDTMVRKHAILTLGDIRSASAIPALVQQLADMEMSRYAFISLLKFGRQALPWLHRHMLKNYTVDIRVRLIDLIGKIGDRKSVEPLMELLEDPSPAVRLAAIDSLAFCFDGLLLKKLTSLKKCDAEAEVRERADLALKTFSMEKYS
ncbi:MAG TPA: HEAT repeat domain-containing protein [Geobacteraceae bacterium]|nr:HEAT repeat domain-containing protein [Geobacteraceae bacterium]